MGIQLIYLFNYYNNEQKKHRSWKLENEYGLSGW